MCGVKKTSQRDALILNLKAVFEKLHSTVKVNLLHDPTEALLKAE